jgi:hypothetical protein
MSRRWPKVWTNIYGVEQPPMPPMTITWVSPRDPSRRGPGRPPNRQAFANAVAYVLGQQAKKPDAKITRLALEAAEKFNVSPQRVREAVKNMGKK